MSNNIITRKDGEWLVISLVPDVCKTPIGSSIIPIPYPTVAKLGDAVKEIPHVKANGAPLVTIAGHIPTTQGAEVGVKKGIKSGTVGGAASYKKDSHSSNVRAGKQPILRHGDMFWMNGKAPDNAPATTSASHIEQRKLRYQERKSLITKTADNGDPVIRAANQRLSLNNDNILRAEAADYVYKVDEYNRGHIKVLPEAPVGLQLQDPTQIPGLENATFTDKKTGFGAALFKSEINNETMLTFRGTNNALTFKEDWGTNIAQGAGIENDQYNQAMRLAKQSKRSLGKNSFSIVGHSLGGGLASASTAITGASGYTFNSAGLHPKTAPRQGGMNNEKASKLITSQWVKGDVLTSVQNYLNPALTGILTGVGASHGGGLGAVVGMLVSKLIPKIPSALGAMNKLESVNGGSPMDRHSMSEVIAGIEAQKKSDMKTLEKVNAS